MVFDTSQAQQAFSIVSHKKVLKNAGVNSNDYLLTI